jgi:ligand-binding sensor domain-containing protein
VCLVASLACAAAPGGAGGAPTPPGSPREDRVLLTEFDFVRGVAASRHMVYVAGSFGLVAYDRDFDRWLPPVYLGFEYAIGYETTIAADPVEEGVWVAAGGELFYYSATLGNVVRTAVPDNVQRIFFDERDPSAGAYLSVGNSWVLATRTGMASQVDPARIPSSLKVGGPPPLQLIYKAYPSLQGAAPLLTRDADLRSWPIRSAALSPDRTEVWLGTAGGGLYRVDPVFLKSEPLPYGPLVTATGALARDSDGVWMAGVDEGIGERAGLAHTSSDLQHWRWLASAAVTRVLKGARPYAMSVRGARIWVATDRGVAVLDASDPDRALLWSETSGLPGGRPIAVAAADSGAWVGAEGGVAYIANTGSERAARSSDVHALSWESTGGASSLLLRGDTLWIGGLSGLYLVRGASPDSPPRRVNIQDARLARPIFALAASDSQVAAATDRALLVIHPATASLVSRYDAVNIAPIAPVTAMAMDANTIWLAGPGGVLVVARASGASQLLPAPGPIPAEAGDVVLDPNFAWIATHQGVVRLRRASDGSVR